MAKTAQRSFKHIVRYFCCIVVGVACGLLLDALLNTVYNPRFFRLTAVIYALAFTGYPLAACFRALIGSIRTYKAGKKLAVPRIASLILPFFAAASLASSDNLGDLVVKSSTVNRAHRQIKAHKTSRKQDFIACLTTDGFGVLICLELFLFCSTVGMGATPSLFLSAAAITLLTALLLGALAPIFGTVQSIGKERRNLRSKPAWSAGERPVEAETEHLFARDEKRRRQYLRLPRTLALLDIFLLIGIILFAVLNRQHPLVFPSEALRLLFVAFIAVLLFACLPLLMWWMDCSGRSLTQTIELEPKSRAVRYSLTSGSGTERTTNSRTITHVYEWHVGSRCIHVTAGQANQRPRHFRIPRTFCDEDRFFAELERLRVHS